MINRTDNTILRYAFGAFLGLAISVFTGGLLDYALPVLTLPFLAADKELSIKEGLNFIGIITIAVLFANVVTLLCLEYPVVLVSVIFLILFFVYYSKHKLMNANMKLWLLIAILLIPNISVQSFAIAQIISLNLISIAVYCIICVWISYYVFPARAALMNQKVKEEVKVEYTREDFDRALIRTVVIMPMVLLFYFFDLASALLVLIFIAILSMQAGFGAGFKAGKALIIGNLIGGLLAIVFYEVYTVVPILSFFLLTVAVMGLVLGKKLFSGIPTAPLFGMAFSTFLLIIGATTGGGDTTANYKVWIRVIQIMSAVIYVAVAFVYVDKWREYINEAP